MRATALLAGAPFVALAITAVSARAAVIDVRLKEQRFEPSIVTAKPGDTIVFHNDDAALHSVFLPDGEALLSEHFIDPGGSYEVVIPTTADPQTSISCAPSI
jgi:plastocyanin